MAAFGTNDVAKLAGLSPRAVRSMVRARYVVPTKGPRGQLRFSFQDLIVLRTARTLATKLPARRLGNALRALRGKVPVDAPAAGFTVAALGDDIIVHEAGTARDARSGQLLLAFDVRIDAAGVRLIDSPAESPGGAPPHDSCEADFQAALALEDTDIEQAMEAYSKCIAAHGHVGAHANLGRLLHLQGRIREAIEHYRAHPEPDAVLLFNLGVALEDLGETGEALAAYDAAIAQDADLADAHFNAGALRQRLGDRQRALRHLNAYRRLTS